VSLILDRKGKQLSEVHETIGEYLAEHDPVLVLWHHLAGIVGVNELGRPSETGLTLPASTIYLVGVFEGAIVKGGFRQFLSDASGAMAQESLQSLREIGAHVCVELLEKALNVFPEGVAPKPLDERLRQLDLADPHYFDAFDELYNQHVDAQSPHRVENINTLLLDYMKEHSAVRLSY
jgi:Domain of unknown function (DUF4375)